MGLPRLERLRPAEGSAGHLNRRAVQVSFPGNKSQVCGSAPSARTWRYQPTLLPTDNCIALAVETHGRAIATLLTERARCLFASRSVAVLVGSSAWSQSLK